MIRVGELRSNQNGGMYMCRHILWIVAVMLLAMPASAADLTPSKPTVKSQAPKTNEESSLKVELEQLVKTTERAGATQPRNPVSQAILAEQIATGSDPSVFSSQSDLMRRRMALGALGAGGAAGYQPIIQVLPEGVQMGAIGVISADRRYVRISIAPTFSTIGDVQTFTFAGAAQATGNGGGTGTGAGGGAAAGP